MMESGACRMRQCPASPCPGRLWTLLLALVGSPLPSPVRSQPHGADPNPTGTSQGVPTLPVVPRRDKMPWEAARVAAGGNGKGRKGSPPSPTRYLGVSAAWGSSSPAAGLGSCRRGEQDGAAGWLSREGAAGLTSEVATSRPGPAAAGAPRGTRGAPAHPEPARCHISAAAPRPSCPRCGTRALCLERSTLPPFPLRLRETSLLPPAGRENRMW